MNRYFLLFYLLLGCSYLHAEKYSLNPSEVRIIGSAKFKDNIVNCNIPPEKAKGLHGVIYQIDLKPFRDSNITLQVSAKAEKLSKPEKRYLGTKFMLIYKTPDGKKHYAEKNGLFGTFQKELTFNHTVDNQATLGELRFCAQNVSGKLQYDLSTFKISKTFEKANSNHICKYSDAVWNRPVHRGVMSSICDQANEENFKVLKSWNVNLMRLQLNTSKYWAKDNNEKYHNWIDDKINNIIPKVLDLGQKYGIKIIIDLHSVPKTASMEKKYDAIFGDGKAVKQFINIWERIAKKFKGHPALYGYDLINEPMQTRPAKYSYWQIQNITAHAIRKVDPETPIYINSNKRSSQYTFSYLSPIKLKNIIYEVHCYDPFSYTHSRYTKKDRLRGEKLSQYPGIFYGTKWNINALRNKLKQVRDFQLKHKAKIFVGEFSTRASSLGGDKFLQDYIDVFEEFKWDWTYHAFREAKIWSLEYAGPSDNELQPSSSNPRKEVMLRAFKKNLQTFNVLSRK